MAFTIVSIPETESFWREIESERPVVAKCATCSSYFFPPLPVCQKCHSKHVALAEISGRATLYSFLIAENPWPEWHSDGPMSVAIVELEEGIRITSTIVDCEQTPEALQIDMKLTATFRYFGRRKMLCFKPVERT